MLKTTGDYGDLYKLVQNIMMQTSKENPRLLNMDTDLKLDKPQLVIEINRNKANALGVSMADIANSLNALLGQPNNNQFEMAGRSYYVIPQLYSKYRATPEQLRDINLRTASGHLVPLSNLVTMTEGIAPQSLNHFQQLRSAKITASLAPGYTLGEALTYLKTTANKLIPENVQYDFGGQSRQFLQSTGGMQQTFLFAVIFIFLVLAAQFESWIIPIAVVLGVPAGVFGAIFTEWFRGIPDDVYCRIGLIMLIGLAAKNAILIVEFARQRRDTGVSIDEAALEAASLRFRPILMTSFAFILGVVPLVRATGAGSASRQSLGSAVFGGMLAATRDANTRTSTIATIGSDTSSAFWRSFSDCSAESLVIGP
jgi:multidrug efflux pump subunit AcrB